MFGTGLEAVLYLVLIGVTLLGVLSIVYRSWRNGISPMPSSAPVRRAVAEEVNRLSRTGTLIEAGSGWGTLALDLARRCQGWTIIGLENSWLPLWVSRALACLSKKQSAVSFQRADLYEYAYEQAAVVVCYLYPGAMKRLSRIFDVKLAPGTVILSVCFALPEWEPERIITCGDVYHTKIYVYTA